ncbi:hypothetical protein O9X81_05230 [Agrobacterium salinitolerans]|uniref:hypothetical protein n=1 Tax=Agrobacterium salinitolerans TaxID=1183413 RepID=UPI0022B81CEF|nr:hypothetical protein [Agrobacterium salinitolerans]MCZ7856009.1 hypothetical protein [Agrobacterium salinitolerans]
MTLKLKSISATTATLTLTKYENGSTIVFNRAAGTAVTLPAPADGATFKFVIGTAPTTANTIATSGSANIIKGGINELEVDTADDGPYSAVGDLISFVANLAVVGDFVDLSSDGTSWFLRGQTNADGGITIGST